MKPETVVACKACGATPGSTALFDMPNGFGCPRCFPHLVPMGARARFNFQGAA